MFELPSHLHPMVVHFPIALFMIALGLEILSFIIPTWIFSFYQVIFNNVCCKFCAKDFKKDPENFIKIIENNLVEGKDPGRDYETDHDEDLEHDKGDHAESDHGEHDHEVHEGEKYEHDEGAPKKEEGHHHDH